MRKSRIIAVLRFRRKHMSAEILQTLGLASAGITVAIAGALVLVLHLVFSSELEKEIDEDLRRRPL
jgi:hypothetical protein